MICATCGAPNDVGRKFCGECGNRLASPCPSCGTPNPPGTKFCGECGSALNEGRAPAPTPASPGASGSSGTSPATERRLVSVLFADLVGFTTLSEGRDAEDVRELLGRYFEVCREVIERYGGTVEKFIGDAVMAVWGTPVAQEDDAERAVRAGLDLVDAVARLGAERGAGDLALRAGVHTGEAVVTVGAAGMGMVAGDLVNTASRLQSVAAPGTVLVGEGTRRAADTAIVFEDAGEQALKGKAETVTAFRALRVVAQRGGIGRAEGLEAPFVGRQAELQLIKDFYHATARERGPRLVSVIGQPGIGKSRLTSEFLNYIDGVVEDVYWHQGRSPAYGEGISFWALGEMVRMRIGVVEGTDEATTRARLGATLDEFVADEGERRTMVDPLLHLLGIGEAPSRDRGRLFVAWRTFFERIADRGPVVMVFEDVQSADEDLLDFIEELLTWSRGRSIYVITLARPELIDRRPTWGAGQRSFTSLNLSPLTDDEMRTILDGLVPGLPEPVAAQIVSRAAGVPLYAVETVRTLLNDGRIARDGDRVRVVGDLASVAVPESLQALIAARIDALPSAERTLVQDASVLGLSFPPAALEAVARSGGEGVEAMLQHLVQRELFTIDHDARSPEHGNFGFVQGLVREVAYGTLSRDDRRSRHLAAARYYEALGDDELAGVLAQHYVDAYRAHPDGPEGQAVAAQARVALRGAAQRATDLGSHRSAHTHLESALVIPTDPNEELELRAAAANAAAYGGLFEAAVRHGRRAVELATELGRDEDRRVATARLADILIEGHQQESMELLRAAMAEPGLGPGMPGYLDLAKVLAKAEMRMQNDRRAIEVADEALGAAGPDADPRYVIELLVTKAVALANLGRVTEGVVILVGALEEARRIGHPDTTNRAAVNLTYAIASDDQARALEVGREAVEEARRHGIVWAIRYILGNAVDSAIEVGAWDWAMESMHEFEPVLTEPAERLWFGVFSGTIRALRGEDNHEELQALYRESRDADDSQYRAMGTYGTTISALIRRDFATAVRISEETVALGVVGVDGGVYAAYAAILAGDVASARRNRDVFATTTHGRRRTALLAAVDGGIAALEGRRGQAAAHFAEAMRLLRELSLRYWSVMVGIEIAAVGALDGDERRQVIDETRAGIDALRAEGLRAILDGVIDSGPSSGSPRSGARQSEEERQRISEA